MIETGDMLRKHWRVIYGLDGNDRHHTTVDGMTLISLLPALILRRFGRPSVDGA